jgi:hypothetical protein
LEWGGRAVKSNYAWSLAKQGFDTQTLRRRHPHLIYCAINGLGADSAYPRSTSAQHGHSGYVRPNGRNTCRRPSAGAGERAFGTGDDTTEKKSEHKGGFGTIGIPVELLHTAIRDVPKPVIAKVRGYAIGGGNVIATMCDLTLAAESAIFGQVGPSMGSVDPGFGTAFLARIVGEKAREIWYLCQRYSAREALAFGPRRDSRRPTRRRSRTVVRRNRAAVAHRDCHREALIQC